MRRRIDTSTMAMGTNISRMHDGLRIRGEGGPADDHDGQDPGFAGDLASLSVFELLQSLHYLRKSGTLELTIDDARRLSESATFLLSTEGLAGARCGSLEEREAVLAALWWSRGRFRFRPGPIVAEGATLSLQDLLLEGVRLADEVEERDDLLPDRVTPLTLVAAELAAPVLAVRGVPEIVDHLRSSAALNRLALENLVPYAPVTIAHAVARLCEEGAVAEGRGAPEARDLVVSTPRPTSEIGAAPTRIVRLAIAFPTHDAKLGLELVTALRLQAGIDMAAHFFDPAGPSFSRMKISADCSLSLTTLPLARRNRFVFETLLDNLRVALFVSRAESEPELQEWMSLIPPGVTALHATDPQEGAGRLLGHLHELRQRATLP